MDRYAVMGNPVAHSKSPRIHAEFARLTNQPIEYGAELVPLEGFSAAVKDFFARGGRGLNVTVPFKQEAWLLAQEHSDDARLAGAVNTLFEDDSGRLQGHNTDGIGLVRDIVQNHGGTLQDKDILLLGAGGAARGILLPLLRERPRRLVVANRTLARAEELAVLFAPHGPVSACAFDALAGQSFDWVLNATSASLQQELPPLPGGLLKADAWCYDLMYGDEETLFCTWSHEQGAARAIDGLGMLVEQAAESFYLWRGVRPLTASVMEMLRG